MTTMPASEPGSSPADPLGPFESAQQAQAAVRHITDLEPGTGQWAAGNRKLLLDACADAGVELGEYDRSILLWMANAWEPWAVASIAGMISRARAAGGQP